MPRKVQVSAHFKFCFRNTKWYHKPSTAGLCHVPQLENQNPLPKKLNPLLILPINIYRLRAIYGHTKMFFPGGDLSLGRL